jgi:hypothetical protein
VRLAVLGSDTSCLEPTGGTVVAGELSDDDVRQNETAIRKMDSLPTMRIGHLAMRGGRWDAGGPEFEGVTGVGCGPLSGHGNLYRISRVDSKWIVAASGSWVS